VSGEPGGKEAVVMKGVFDLVESIYETIVENFEMTGREPQALVLSPASYRRLLEIKSDDPAAINPLGHFRLVIDEIFPDTKVGVE
jgi:hypothetical protein